MASKYHKEESKKILERVGDQKDGVERLTFKDIDGIRKLADLELPGLLKLPTGSCEAIFFYEVQEIMDLVTCQLTNILGTDSQS